MSGYRRGRDLEYRARDRLIDRGYTVVRSAGSKGPVDLVAISQEQILLIQVKAAGQCWPADIEKLRAIPTPDLGVDKEIWEWGAIQKSWSVTRVSKTEVSNHVTNHEKSR